MATDLIRYDLIYQDAMRGIVRKVMADAARDGLPGDHHFVISFRTQAPGVRLSAKMRKQYPATMTIVLQHQFWGLEVRDQDFSVTLTFQGRPEQLTIPFAAVTSFADPSVKFGLQFEATATELPEVAALPAQMPADAAAKPERQAAEIVTLDKFRKR